MKASETHLTTLLKGPKQFIIPIYQRPYSWTEEQCRQLFDDVLRVASNATQSAHFIGSVVYVQRGLYQATEVPELLVIDGQQRLTTFALMVEAIARTIESGKEESEAGVSPRKLRNYFLFNSDEDGPLRFKIVLSSPDDATLKAIVQGKDLPKPSAERLVENLAYFQKRVADSGVSADVLYEGLCKLLVVGVALDRQNDNPQLIFESLNSTGLDLSQADLVRNFVLMGLDPSAQEELYGEHWRPMEQLLDSSEREGAFDRFLRAWLTLRTGEVPKFGNGYEVFKRYRSEHPEQSMADLVADLHRFAEHYARIALGRETVSQLARIWKGLASLQIDAPLPFVMLALDRCERGVIGEEEVVAVASLIESWLVRRMICDIPSNVLSRTFATLPRVTDAEAILDSLSAWLVLRKGRQRFPSDAEFERALTTRNFYELKAKQYYLGRLENEGRKEPVDVTAFTIEHVMPQNEQLSATWRAMLGDDWRAVHERSLHVLGNLTLTGYNPELSDRSFEQKRDMEGGFKDSPLRLNQTLAKRETWNEDAILERSEELASKAIRVWREPSPSKEWLERMRASLVRPSASSSTSSSGEVLTLNGELASMMEALVDGLGEAGLEAIALKTQYAFVLPSVGRRTLIAAWPVKDALQINLRGFLGAVRPVPGWFEARANKAGALRIRVNATSVEQVEAVAEFVQSAIGAEAEAE
jgi:uncharacterized protein with ParB-like and HNH nuclease domain